MTNYKKIAGFTLIELSVSLIILTLLITSVAGGASLLEAAKYRKIISEFNQYRYAVKGFEARYDATPGKFNNASSYWPPTIALADNLVNGSGGIGPVSENYETPLVWVHLSKAGLMSDSFDYSDQTNGYVGSQVPGATKFAPTSHAFDAGGFMMVRGAAAPYATGISAFVETNENVVYLAASISMSTTLSIPIAVLTPKEAFEIDSKIDDGEPDMNHNFIGGSSGKFRVINSLNYISTFDCVNSSGNYTKSDNKSCIVGFRMY